MSDQKFWDASLIKVWRTSGSISDALNLFTALTGKTAEHIEPRLKRMPRPGMPYQIQVKVFVASYLPKLNERLWAQTPDKDVLLLRKLQESSYDTLPSQFNPDKDVKKINREHKKNIEVIKLDVTLYANRNQATDWNVTQGKYRLKRPK